MGQILTIYNPQTHESIGNKPRYLVHQNGYWHKAVKSILLVSEGDKELKVIVQQRSGVVDLEKFTYDQSCNTHYLLDETDVLKVFYRGIKEELGISKKSVLKVFKFGNGDKLVSSRRYRNYPGIVNNELIEFVVGVVRVRGEKNSRKVLGLEAVPYSEYCQKVLKEYQNFTRTARYFLYHPEFRNHLDMVVASWRNYKRDVVQVELGFSSLYHSYINYDVYIDRLDKKSVYRVVKLGDKLELVDQGETIGELDCIYDKNQIILISKNQIIYKIKDR